MTLQERHPEIREYLVRNGMALPVNPHRKPKPTDGHILQEEGNFLASLYYQFEAAHRDKVYPTDLSPGKYKAEELKFQIKHTKGWSDLRSEEIDTYLNTNAELRITRADQPEAKEVENTALCIETLHDFFFKGKSYVYSQGTASDPVFINEKGHTHTVGSEVVKHYFEFVTTPINPNAGEKETVEDAAFDEANYWVTDNNDYSFSNHQVHQFVQKAYLHGANYRDHEVNHLQTEISEKDAQIERLKELVNNASTAIDGLICELKKEPTVDTVLIDIARSMQAELLTIKNK